MLVISLQKRVWCIIVGSAPPYILIRVRQISVVRRSEYEENNIIHRSVGIVGG
jgi:hypothetical protein